MLARKKNSLLLLLVNRCKLCYFDGYRCLNVKVDFTKSFQFRFSAGAFECSFSILKHEYLATSLTVFPCALFWILLLAMALRFWLPCPCYSPRNNIHLSSPLLPRPPSPSFRSRNGKKWAHQLRIASVDAAAEDLPSILVAAARHHAALRAAESLRKG